MKIGRVLATVALIAAAGVAAVAVAGPAAGLNLRLASDGQQSGDDNGSKTENIHFQLALSSDALRKCFPHARVNVSVALRTDQIGKDVIKIDATGLPAKTSFTAFFLEVPAAPFGAAQYFGDVNTDKYGKAHAEFELIVQEAFASTLVDGNRVRVDLNHMGMWFADPADDDSCFGDGGGPVTPFDGDNEAGVQIFNSANSLPGAPLPAP